MLCKIWKLSLEERCQHSSHYSVENLGLHTARRRSVRDTLDVHQSVICVTVAWRS